MQWNWGEEQKKNHFSVLQESFMKGDVCLLHNKMVLCRENTNTFWNWLQVCFSIHIYLCSIGVCILIATHIINRLPSQVLMGITPYEVIFATPLHYAHLKFVVVCVKSLHYLMVGTSFSQSTRICFHWVYPQSERIHSHGPG